MRNTVSDYPSIFPIEEDRMSHDYDEVPEDEEDGSHKEALEVRMMVGCCSNKNSLNKPFILNWDWPFIFCSLDWDWPIFVTWAARGAPYI